MSIRLTAQLDARPAASGFVIEQTKGELMFAYGITADEAFDPPRSLSQDRNIKVRDIATRLTATFPPQPVGPGGGARWGRRFRRIRDGVIRRGVLAVSGRLAADPGRPPLRLSCPSAGPMS